MPNQDLEGIIATNQSRSDETGDVNGSDVNLNPLLGIQESEIKKFTS